MYSSPPPSPPSPSRHSHHSEDQEDWKQKYYEVSDLLTETRAELDEFTKTSRELEEELERDLERTEKAQDDLRQRVSKVEGERDDWKTKFVALQHNHNTTVNSLQRELDATRQSVQLYKAQVRELEMGNDDLERNERQATSSLVDIEQRYSKALEDKILLEHELQDKAVLEETCQRLRDELRDTIVEVTVLKDQLEQNKHLPLRPAMIDYHTNSSSSLPLVSPTGSEGDSLMRTSAPDLSLADLMPTNLSSTSIRSSLQSRLSQEMLDDEYASSRDSPTSFTSHVSNGRQATNSTPTQKNFLERTLSPTSSSALTRLPTPRRRLVGPSPSPQPVPSPHAPRIPVAASRVAQPKSKGVQMVSEMRARVRTLEQRIHANMPRLRGANPVAGSATSLAVSRLVRPPSRNALAGAGFRTPKKAISTTGIGKDPASPWVLIADDGAGNTTLQQPPSPDKPPQLPPMPNMSPIVPVANFGSSTSSGSIRPPSRVGSGRSASALGRHIERSVSAHHNPRNRSPFPPPTAFPSTTTGPKVNPPRASSAGGTPPVKQPSRMVAFASSSTTSSLGPHSPPSDGRPTTPTFSRQPTTSGGLRRAHTVSSPSKPPTLSPSKLPGASPSKAAQSAFLARQRLNSTHKPTGVANTAHAGTTPGRPTKVRSVTGPDAPPPPPVPLLPNGAHATSKNTVLMMGQSRIGLAPQPLTKSKIGRPNSYGTARVLMEGLVGDEDDEDAENVGMGKSLALPLTGRNRAGTMI